MLPVTSGAFTSSGRDQSVLSTAVKQLRRRFGRKLRRLFRKHRLLLVGLVLGLSLLWCFRRAGRAESALPVAVSVMQFIHYFRSRSPYSDHLRKELTTSRFCHADEHFWFAASHQACMTHNAPANDAFPVRTRQFSQDIQDNHTDFLLCAYSDHMMIMVTQTESLGTIMQAR